MQSVTSKNGPFEFIKSSHTMMSNKDGWINDDIVYKSIKKENIFVGTVQKNYDNCGYQGIMCSRLKMDIEWLLSFSIIYVIGETRQI